MDKKQTAEKLNGELNYYTYKATPGQFDADRVSVILDQLQNIEPAPELADFDARESLAGFKKKYKRRLLNDRKWLISVAALLFITLLFSINLGTNARKMKNGFIEYKEIDNGIQYQFDGSMGQNIADTDKPQFYFSWDELPEDILNTIKHPGYIPEYLSLFKITVTDAKLKALYLDSNGTRSLSIIYNLNNHTFEINDSADLSDEEFNRVLESFR